jgi:hypothetical protein
MFKKGIGSTNFDYWKPMLKINAENSYKKPTTRIHYMLLEINIVNNYQKSLLLKTTTIFLLLKTYYQFLKCLDFESRISTI